MKDLLWAASDLMLLTDRQINEGVSITLYVLYYIAATAFHFPLGRINMSLAAM